MQAFGRIEDLLLGLGKDSRTPYERIERNHVLGAIDHLRVVMVIELVIVSQDYDVQAFGEAGLEARIWLFQLLKIRFMRVRAEELGKTQRDLAQDRAVFRAS